MLRARAATLGLALATLGLAACADAGETTIAAADNGTTGISVTGQGEAEAPPDTGYVRVGVSVTAATVAEARETAATAAAAIIEAVKARGVDEKDIQTVDVSIYPNYSTPPAGEAPRLVSYTMTNTVAVTIRDLEVFSQIVDDAIAAGGDNSRLQGISFGIEDDEALLREAREKAMADARAKAEQLASLAGVEIGEPLSITESLQSIPDYGLYFGLPLPPATGGPTPIEPGTAKVVVTVNVRWSIADGETGG